MAAGTGPLNPMLRAIVVLLLVAATLAADGDARAQLQSRPYRIYAITKRDGIDFNLASIPADFSVGSDEPFDQKYMTALFDRGYQLAAGHYSWLKTPPGMDGISILPVLLYHSIAPSARPEQYGWVTAPEVFADHMAYLQDEGYRTLTVSEYAAMLHHSRKGRNDGDTAGKTNQEAGLCATADRR